MYSDMAWKDKSNKHFPANFKLEIFLAAAPDFEENAETNGIAHHQDEHVNLTSLVQEKEAVLWVMVKVRNKEPLTRKHEAALVLHTPHEPLATPR